MLSKLRVTVMHIYVLRKIRTEHVEQIIKLSMYVAKDGELSTLWEGCPHQCILRSKQSFDIDEDLEDVFVVKFLLNAEVRYHLFYKIERDGFAEMRAIIR